MENPDFYLCKVNGNEKWYRCRKCGTIEHYVPAVCPVCEGKGDLQSKVDPAIAELFEILTGGINNEK